MSERERGEVLGWKWGFFSYMVDWVTETDCRGREREQIVESSSSSSLSLYNCE